MFRAVLSVDWELNGYWNCAISDEDVLEDMGASFSGEKFISKVDILCSYISFVDPPGREIFLKRSPELSVPESLDPLHPFIPTISVGSRDISVHVYFSYDGGDIVADFRSQQYHERLFSEEIRKRFVELCLGSRKVKILKVYSFHPEFMSLIIEGIRDRERYLAVVKGEGNPIKLDLSLIATKDLPAGEIVGIVRKSER